MKRILVRSLLLVVTLLIIKNSTITCYACTREIGSKIVYDNKAIIHNEITEWKYRYYNGKKQKRLWSRTNNCWISDHWIDV